MSLGGTLATSTTFSLHTSLGGEAIGISTAPTFTLKAGFLYFPAPAAAAPAATSAPPHVITGRAEEPLPVEAPPGTRTCDFNNDKVCNIFDLSIFLYWLDKPVEAGSRFDLNNDNVLDIVDISFIFYYWE